MATPCTALLACLKFRNDKSLLHFCLGYLKIFFSFLLQLLYTKHAYYCRVAVCCQAIMSCLLLYTCEPCLFAEPLVSFSVKLVMHAQKNSNCNLKGRVDYSYLKFDMTSPCSLICYWRIHWFPLKIMHY